MLVTWLLVRGVKESAGANTGMVLIKITAIAIFCLGAARAINTANWHPFMPHGMSGVLTGASIVFFTYIGSIPYPPPPRSAGSRSAIFPWASLRRW